DTVNAVTSRLYGDFDPDDLATAHRVLVGVIERAAQLRDALQPAKTPPPAAPDASWPAPLSPAAQISAPSLPRRFTDEVASNSTHPAPAMVGAQPSWQVVVNRRG